MVAADSVPFTMFFGKAGMAWFRRMVGWLMPVTDTSAMGAGELELRMLAVTVTALLPGTKRT